MKKGALRPLFYSAVSSRLLAVCDLLHAGDEHGVGLVLCTLYWRAVAELALQPVFLAPAGLDGIALLISGLVECRNRIAVGLFIRDGIDNEVALADSEITGLAELADDGLGLELDRVHPALAHLVIAEADNFFILGAAVIDGGGQPGNGFLLAVPVAEHQAFHGQRD